MEGLARNLDFYRGVTLGLTNRLPILRKCYANRALRLLSLYILAVLIYLPLSLYIPLVLLVVGPLLWGFPHLIASLRFVPKFFTEKTQSYNLIIVMASVSFTLVTLWRLFVDIETNVYLIELILAGVTVIGACFIRPRLNILQILAAATTVGVVTFLSFRIPLIVAGSLVLIHNLIAFFYWIGAAQTKSEKYVALFATISFTAISVGMLFGAFDWMYLWKPQGHIAFLNLDYKSYGQMIVGDPFASKVILFRCVVAYAFGQALHYFVWLKAIPDQLRGVQTPTCYQQSWRYLARDLGTNGRRLGVAACVLGWLAFPIIGFELWRSLYVAAASFHGFFEIAGLGLISWRKVWS